VPSEYQVPRVSTTTTHSRVAPEGRVGRLERGVFRNVFVVYSGIEEALRVERDVLAVGGPGDDWRRRCFISRAEHIGMDRHAVAQLDRHVPLDQHRVLVRARE